MSMRMEDIIYLCRSYASNLDKHFDDAYVQAFKNLMSSRKGASKGLKDDFLSYLEIYTEGTRDIASFMELITGAMEEITDGLYKGDDRDFLYSILREFEHYGLNMHFQSFWGMFPFGLSRQYASDGVGDDRKILVPLNHYRNMQYSLLLLREKMTQQGGKHQ